MAKTTYQSIPAGLEEGFFKCLKSGDRFTYARFSRSKTIISRKLKNKLTSKSLLPIIKDFWNPFTTEQKAAWSAAGVACGKTGYRLFVQDQSYRIKYDVAGVATPSTYHQYKVGYLSIAAPATEIQIKQLHPQFYWVLAPVVGKKGMKEPVKVTENFSLPLKIGLNYKSNLVSQGAGSFARLYGEVWSIYQGQDILTPFYIDLDLTTSTFAACGIAECGYWECGNQADNDWASVEATCDFVHGLAIGYNLFIHLYNLRGDLYIDIIKAEHNATNWARDPYCLDINQAFTKAFYQIPKHWAAVILPEGAGYDSIYPE